jgi:hypothetical protein
MRPGLFCSSFDRPEIGKAWDGVRRRLHAAVIAAQLRQVSQGMPAAAIGCCPSHCRRGTSHCPSLRPALLPSPRARRHLSVIIPTEAPLLTEFCSACGCQPFGHARNGGRRSARCAVDRSRQPAIQNVDDASFRSIRPAQVIASRREGFGYPPATAITPRGGRSRDSSRPCGRCGRNAVDGRGRTLRQARSTGARRRPAAG